MLRPWTRALQALLAVDLELRAAVMLLDLLYLRLGRAYLTDPRSVDSHSLQIVGALRDRIWIAQMGLWLLVVVATITWSYHAVDVLRRRRRGDGGFTPVRAVWAWLPLVNLVQVPRLLLELWRKSALGVTTPRARHGRDRYLPALLFSWVVLFVFTAGSGALHALMLRRPPPYATVSSYLSAGLRAELLTHGLWIATELLALILVGHLAGRITLCVFGPTARFFGWPMNSRWSVDR